MKFVIKDSKDKQRLIHYLKELGNDYIVDKRNKRTTDQLCRIIIIGSV